MHKVSHTEVVVRVMSKQNPHQVTIDPYGLSPRPEKVRCSSWVLKRGTRTFGFKTEAEALGFMDKYGGKYVNKEQASA